MRICACRTFAQESLPSYRVSQYSALDIGGGGAAAPPPACCTAPLSSSP